MEQPTAFASYHDREAMIHLCSKVVNEATAENICHVMTEMLELRKGEDETSKASVRSPVVYVLSCWHLCSKDCLHCYTF